MARSIFLVISFIIAGFLAISIACLILFGSLSTCANSGFVSISCLTCGFIIIMDRTSSGLLNMLCIMGESIIWRIISGFCISCCCMALRSMFPPAPGDAPNPGNAPKGLAVPIPNGDGCGAAAPNAFGKVVEAVGVGVTVGATARGADAFGTAGPNPFVAAVAAPVPAAVPAPAPAAAAAPDRTKCMVCPFSSPVLVSSSNVWVSFNTCPR
mmetsp:Transcript_5946/g.10697  ORF Transcript_5946/g.10697 Transcript_5946/m.10697 type:complete len:211 (-) Transcript_5946:346-978(-)